MKGFIDKSKTRVRVKKTHDTKKIDTFLLKFKNLIKEIRDFSKSEKIILFNEMKLLLRKYSPFANEPVDCVLWVPVSDVMANDYNPNSVAPPEMELLEHSISEDGFTQPIVSWKNEEKYEVVDGFHRNRVGRECPAVFKKVNGHLPVVIINNERLGRNDRIASTIRHNRARGKHQIDSMSEIVIELKKRNWSPKKIGKELGMDQDEVLRLVQITGLAEMFADKEFSEAWEVDLSVDNDAENYETID